MNKKIYGGTLSIIMAVLLVISVAIPVFADTDGNNARSSSSASLKTLGPEDKPQNAGEGKPSWFPEGDPDDFERFHDEDAPRVLDYAGIFTEEEREQLAEKLSEMKETYGYDFVFLSEDYVYEDVNDYFYYETDDYYDYEDYNYYRQYYSGYFYDFNGYGVGENYDGIILYVNLTDFKRGWFSCATGACMNFLTENTVNVLDDQLEPFMYDGNYSLGIFDYFNNLDGMLKTIEDRSNFPSWYPEDTDSFVRTADESKPRVIDNADLFSDSEEEKLNKLINKMKESFGYDFVILTENETNTSYDYYCGMLGENYESQYLNDYYLYNGYGTGENFSGAMLYLNDKDGYIASAFNFFGDCESYNTSEVKGKFDIDLEDYLNESDKYFKAAKNFLNHTSTVLRGKALIIYDDVESSLYVGGIGGAIVAFIVVLICKRKMKTVKKAKDADRYVTRFDVTRNRDVYLNTTTTRRKIERSSSSGGGGGSSHFSGGFSGGGGSSHSGGGRSF